MSRTFVVSGGAAAANREPGNQTLPFLNIPPTFGATTHLLSEGPWDVGKGHIENEEAPEDSHIAWSASLTGMLECSLDVTPTLGRALVHSILEFENHTLAPLM